ncbi:MAG: hypothetical protein ACOC3D_12275 [Pseudomonadota bacterium]
MRRAEHWRRVTNGAFDARVQPPWRAPAEGRNVAAAAAIVAATAIHATPATLAAEGPGCTVIGRTHGGRLVRFGA